MRPLWHPVSAVLLADPPVAAGPAALRLLLRAGPLTLRYAGDRMAPTLRHGEMVRVGAAAPLVGAVVLADVGDVPDLYRVEAEEGARFLLRGDADPAPGTWVRPQAVLAVAELPVRRVGDLRRMLSRAALDLREAWSERADAGDGADVRRKYEAQAPFYATAGAELDPALLARALRAFEAGGRVLVAGSGVGTECFGLAAAGYRVRGLDFAPAMVAAARREAERRGLDLEFLEADLRSHEEPPRSLAGVLFTYDVYSFLPVAAERVALLRRMARWLSPQGAILLSARKARGLWARLVLTLQWLAGRMQRPWGASHTRWLTVQGDLCRSFVQVFPSRVLQREWRAAGLRGEEWQGGHGVLTPAGAA